MPKFEMKFKLTGLEVEIKGERGDLPMIAQNVGQQVAKMMEPSTNILEAKSIEVNTSEIIDVTPKKRAKRSAGVAPRSETPPPTWRHDASKYGMPLQDWPAQKKMTWLLYVARDMKVATELPATAIYKSFNTQFKEAGQLISNNATRDLGRLKISQLVGEDATKTPSVWFLQAEGVKQGAELVKEALAAKS